MTKKISKCLGENVNFIYFFDATIVFLPRPCLTSPTSISAIGASIGLITMVITILSN